MVSTSTSETIGGGSQLGSEVRMSNVHQPMGSFTNGESTEVNRSIFSHNHGRVVTRRTDNRPLGEDGENPASSLSPDHGRRGEADQAVILKFKFGTGDEILVAPNAGDLAPINRVSNHLAIKVDHDRAVN
jgi:hypothetical protein